MTKKIKADHNLICYEHRGYGIGYGILLIIVLIITIVDTTPPNISFINLTSEGGGVSGYHFNNTNNIEFICWSHEYTYFDYLFQKVRMLWD